MGLAPVLRIQMRRISIICLDHHVTLIGQFGRRRRKANAPVMADMVFETMMDNPYSKSIEARVLSATPLELVVILYDETINAVRAARAHLASGDIRARSRSVSKAVAFLLELGNSLNFEAGGELSKRLAGLYGFMRSSLLEANFRQTDEGLATTEELLVSLREAWSAISAQGQNQPQPSSSAKDEKEKSVAAAPSFPWSVLGESVSAARCWSA